jgi:hypothetical protein
MKMKDDKKEILRRISFILYPSSYFLPEVPWR